LAAPLDEHCEIVCLGTYRRRDCAVIIEAPPALQNLLGALLILPEVRFRDLRLDLP
jgi:hypothetical protein